MNKVYKILKKILPEYFYTYFQNIKRLYGLPVEIRRIVDDLKPNDICLDCGANVGIYSQLFAKYGSKVYAFEPDPVPFKELFAKSQNFKNIYPIMAAVGTSNKDGKLYLDNNYNSDKLFYSEHNSLVKEKDNVGESYINVKIIDIVDWLEKHEKIKFMKIDIEGYEIELLRYLIESNAIYKIEFIFLETHEKRIEGLKEQIVDLKYKIKVLGIQEKIFWNWP